MFCIIKKLGYLVLLALLSNLTFAQTSKEAAQKALGNSSSASEIISLIESGDPAEVFDAIVKLNAESKSKVLKYYELGKSENINPVRFKRGVRSIILGLYEEQRYPASEFLIDYNKFKKTGEIPSKSLPDAFRDLERATNIVPSSKGVFEASIEKFAKIKSQIEEIAIQKMNGYNEKLANKEKNEALVKEVNALNAAVDNAKVEIAAAKKIKDKPAVLRKYQEIVNLRENILSLAHPDNRAVREWNLLFAKRNFHDQQSEIFMENKDFANWIKSEEKITAIYLAMSRHSLAEIDITTDAIIRHLDLATLLGLQGKFDAARNTCTDAESIAFDPMLQEVCVDLAKGVDIKYLKKWNSKIGSAPDLSMERALAVGYYDMGAGWLYFFQKDTGGIDIHEYRKALWDRCFIVGDSDCHVKPLKQITNNKNIQKSQLIFVEKLMKQSFFRGYDALLNRISNKL